MGVDAYQSYQRKFALKELLVEVLLRLKQNRVDAQNLFYIRTIALAFFCYTSINADLEDASKVCLIVLQIMLPEAEWSIQTCTSDFAHINWPNMYRKIKTYSQFLNKTRHFSPNAILMPKLRYKSRVLHCHDTRCSWFMLIQHQHQVVFKTRSSLGYTYNFMAVRKIDFNGISFATVDCRHDHQDSNARIASG